MAADGVSTRWRCAFLLFTILLIGVLGCLCFFYLQLLEIKQELRDLRSSRDIIVKKYDHTGKRDSRDGEKLQNDNVKGDLESASKRDNSGKRQSASNFMQELLTAQAHILESHCSNDSRLCMRGPKGEKGDSGVISNPSNFVVPTLPPRPCACLEEPKIGPLQNTIASSGDDVNIACLVTGTPTPYVTWKQNGVTVSNNAVLQLTNVNAGMSGNYSCVARNLVGDQSKTIVLKVL